MATEATTVLTEEQTKLARLMLGMRPPVIPGTRVVPDQAAREVWYRQVSLAMDKAGIASTDKERIHAFCDVAGVPD